MKIVLIQGISSQEIANPPIGLLYLSAVLEERGHFVKIIVPNAPYFPKNYSKAIESRIKSFSPDIIGISIYTTNVLTTYKLIELLKKFNKPIIAGGPHATLLPYEVLNHNADIVTIGEGEETIQEIVEFYLGEKRIENITGIAYKDKNGVLRTNPKRNRIKDLDLLPFPARHLCDNSDYIRKKSDYQIMGYLLGVRGCPNKCTYCSQDVFKSVYSRSPESVIREITYLHKKYGITHFNFLDDAFSAYRQNIITLCNLIIEKKLEITWECITRLDYVNTEILNLLKQSGCCSINYGIESANNYTLGRIGKKFTKETAEQVIRWTHEAGLKMDVNFVWGFPWENEGDIKKTLDFIKEHESHFSNIMRSGLLIPFPGTKLYEEGNAEFKFKNWWLDKKNYDDNPFLYQKILFRDSLLYNSFYHYSISVRKELKRVINFIAEKNFKSFNRKDRLFWKTVANCSKFLARTIPFFEIHIFQPIFYFLRNSKTILMKNSRA